MDERPKERVKRQWNRKDLRREEIIWAAGFFDGEGGIAVRVAPAKHLRVLAIRISQSNRQVLDRFHKAVLGLGEVRGPYGPYKSHPKGARPFFSYTTDKFEHSQAVIFMLYSFLSPEKQRHCREALASYQNKTATPKRRREGTCLNRIFKRVLRSGEITHQTSL